MRNKMKKSSIAKLVLVNLLVVVLLVVNVAGIRYYNVITQFFYKVETDEERIAEVTKEASEIIERIAGEGIVLLKNENDSLPLDTSDDREMNINLFGWSVVDPVISGGIGSGTGNTSSTLDIIGGMENNGFSVNRELIDFYESLDYSRGVVNDWGSFDVELNKVEAPLDVYDPILFSNAQEFSDVAVIVLSRLGSEMEDLPTDMSEFGGQADEHYLELGEDEEALLDKVISMDFEKVIVLINSSFPMELGFLDEKGVDAALWIGAPGQTGSNSVAKVLNGEINPSGRLVDTYAYDLTSAPSFQNFGEFIYTGKSYTAMNYFGEEEQRDYNYVDYAEGIYVGYRYYETVCIDNETGERDEELYNQLVQYPFGYGLSYSSFSQEIVDFSYNDEEATIKVKVENTGDVAGKDVVQVYVTAPYTEGGIEKSHVSLIGFEKTEFLKPGKSETIEITFDIEDMASFDYINNGCYVLEEGSYEIKLMSNAHDLVNSRNIEVSETIIYNENNKRESDEIAAVARFQDVQGDVKYLSRSDWEGTFPSNVPREREASEELSEKLLYQGPNLDLVDPNAEDIVIRDNGLTLEDMIGLEYDDPKWELLLELLSVEDMQKLIGLGGYATQEIKSVGKPYVVDLDGPAGINALVNEHSYDAVMYPTAVTIASTWNEDLAYEMGVVFGKEANEWGVSGIYGPSMNIHRTPFNGRNFEYYSEDGFLSGKIAAGIVSGLRSKNVYAYIKHFALYDQTSYAFGASMWSNEQAMREIYLKPFEIAVKEGEAFALMSSYNRIGSTWTGGSYALLTEVLRNEWGFRGMVITDWFTPEVMNADQGIYAGNDLMLITYTGSEPQDTSNAGKQAMRNACHNILYTVANSNAVIIDNPSIFPYWFVGLIVIDILALIGVILFYIRRSKIRKIG